LERGLQRPFDRNEDISKSQIYRLREKAILRGWDPKVSLVAEIEHIQDTLCSRRPPISPEIKDLIIETMIKNCNRVMLIYNI
jgi:hypothetical protein